MEALVTEKEVFILADQALKAVVDQSATSVGTSGSPTT